MNRLFFVLVSVFGLGTQFALMPLQAQVIIPASPLDASTTLSNDSNVSISGTQYAVRLYNQGTNGSDNGSGDAGSGTSAGFLTATNSGTISQGAGSGDGTVYAVAFDNLGGNGGNATNDDGKDNAGFGGNADGLNGTNTGAISAQTGSAYSNTVHLLFARSLGGSGGTVSTDKTDGDGLPEFDGGLGRPGGTGGNVTLTNSGSISAGTAGSPLQSNASGGLTGIHAISKSGTTGVGEEGTAGAAAGTVSVTNSNSITLVYEATGSEASSLYGIYAASAAAAGAPSYKETYNGGAGGAASSVTVVNNGAQIFIQNNPNQPVGTGPAVSGAGIGVYTTGGAGGYAATGDWSSEVYSVGGAGGSAAMDNNGSSVTINGGNVVAYGNNLAAIQVSNIAGGGGHGGLNKDYSSGGAGGDAGKATIEINSSTQESVIATTGEYAPGLYALSVGGGGGYGTNYDNPFAGIGAAGNGGNGGSGGSIVIGFNAISNYTGSVAEVDTLGNNSSAIAAYSYGGDGGDGGYIQGSSSTLSVGSTGGAGGDAGSVTVNDLNNSSSGSFSVSTQGESSFGIVAVSLGGSGGDAGYVESQADSGHDGGRGGSGGAVSVALPQGARVTTNGTSSHGILARSIGQSGGDGGDVKDNLGNSAGDGGTGGSSGTVTVTNFNTAKIITLADNSFGIVAQSLSGGGGDGGTAENSAGGQGGSGGQGGQTGTVTVNNDGIISTSGAGSYGIIAQAISGFGGDAGDGSGLFYASGGTGGSSGIVSGVTVNQSSQGSITTGGDGSHGIHVQSVAGGGGAAGSSISGTVSIGGSAASNPYTADGGTVTVNGNGSVVTSGTSAYGVLAQSIGGGGGDGGTGAGWIGIGGAGGQGGTGGASNIYFESGGSIQTTGAQSHGAVAQSIGGGGGSGGDADSLGFEVAFAMGASGATAGDGGAAQIVMGDYVTISTAGSNAAGLVVQSIGGGGGAGGNAFATSGGIGFSAAGAVGGNGGGGGNGHTALVSISAITISTGSGIASASNIQPVDSFGIVAQSIGGGGGHGGSSTANALAAAVPIPDTDTQISVSASASVGGNGGTGGYGEEVTVLLGNETQLTTQGQGSHGVVAQSIGGGGGTGGDSSTLAATLGYKIDPQFSVSLDAAFSLGGKGGIAGAGGTVDVVVGGTSDTNLTDTATLVTYGDYANAVLAQSIGGGGGNAGVGSSNTADRGSTVNVGVGIGLGGSGGSGGTGGVVTVGTSAESTITTYGSNANAIVAQSIAGGGGTSQGGMINLGASGSVSVGGGDGDGEDDDTELDLSGNVSVALGANGVDGSYSNTVTVNQNATIQTFGNDSAGVIAQSIAGGGGLGGSAGNDASADNPVDPSTGDRGDNLPSDGTIPFSATLAVTLGGSGASGGNAGEVNVNQTGTIMTAGDWSKGILAQSIGGGGGKGGTAVGQGADSKPDLSIAVSAGGSGGAGGDGGAVTITTSDSSLVQTQGYSAIGIMGQSIGGGGGFGADGSGSAAGSSGNPGLISIGADSDGSGGGAGNGSTVTLSGGGWVQTSGEAAAAIVLQSIGGGGGAAGQGATLSGSLGPADTSMHLSVGGGSGASGHGNTVTFDGSAMTIITTGDNAAGLIAQSIGGGGGLGWLQKGATMDYTFGGDGATGDGGVVHVSLDSDSSITTSGVGAHGIIAQSIGGGGGIAGYLLGDSQSYSMVLGKRGSSTGNGGDVTVNVNSNIMTTGDGSIGVLAQSIGGGGGILGGNSTSMGTSGTGASGMGGSVNVTVAEGASVNASGANSIGVFAQSTGVESGYEVNGVTLTIDGTVRGGSGDQGFGIWVDANGSEPNFQQSQVNIGSNGYVGAASGTAFRLTGENGTVVNNSGIIEGSVDADAGINAIINSGIVRTQAPLSSSNGAYNFVHSTYTAYFEQTDGGTIYANADFVGGNSDRITINSEAELAGTITLNPVTAAPNTSVVPFVIGSGYDYIGTLTIASSSIYDYFLQADVMGSGTNFFVTITAADFSSPDISLTPDQLQVANHLQSIWDSGSSDDLAVLFGSLGSAANSGSYAALLDELSPGATLAPGAARLISIQSFSNNALSFPLFEGDSPMLVEGPNAWVRTSGRFSSWNSNGGGAGFDFSSTTWQTGGQAEVAPDWFLGGSIGYEYSWLNSKDGRVSGSGDTALGAITLKHQRDAWLFSAAVYGSASWSNTQRRVNVAGFPPATAEGSPANQSVGGLIRASYTIGGEFLYARPQVTAGTVSIFSGSFNENGAGALDLRYDSSSYTTFVGSPMLELGSRVNINETTILRLYGSGGFSWLSNDSYSQSARLAGAPAGAAPIQSIIPIDDFVPRLEIGAQLNLNDRISVQLRYEGEYGSNTTAHGGSLGAAWQF